MIRSVLQYVAQGSIALVILQDNLAGLSPTTSHCQLSRGVTKRHPFGTLNMQWRPRIVLQASLSCCACCETERVKPRRGLTAFETIQMPRCIRLEAETGMQTVCNMRYGSNRAIIGRSLKRRPVRRIDEVALRLTQDAKHQSSRLLTRSCHAAYQR